MVGARFVVDEALNGSPNEMEFAGEKRFNGKLVGWRGLEPRTNALKGHCSTN
jgi:hypothetical protein